MKKICTKCKNPKALEVFARKGKGHQSYCLDCQKQNSAEWYINNKQQQLANINRNRKRDGSAFYAWKTTLHCYCCPENYPACLDFHHLHSKDFTVSERVMTAGLKTVSRELKKCIVLCSNCHRKLHSGVITLNNVVCLNVTAEDIRVFMPPPSDGAGTSNLSIAGSNPAGGTKIMEEVRSELTNRPIHQT